jgi:hypothetical protein
VVYYPPAQKWAAIDKSGREILPVIYDNVEYPTEGLALVRLNGQAMFVDEKGEIVLRPKASICSRFLNGFARAKLKDRFGFINKAGRGGYTLHL